ncbi:ubiquinol-cytochrome C chaperone family protein [Candidatus Pelagibacter sp.]|nr:ubiquinol-cytochrome C chaperone family protein [Candidatus Pelagibacter sp.]
MNSEYLDFYNNLIKLTTNKSLYDGILNKHDSFSDRLTLFLIHFAFTLKEFKSDKNKKQLQDLYDFNFRQLELSIREIGYGDQSINKKMKDYINVFHAIISEIHFWDKLEYKDKQEKLSIFLPNFTNIKYLVDYFGEFRENLSKNNLNSYIKSVSNQ